MSHQRNRQLREVAILVASLDEHWTKQLLANFPAKDVAQIWEAVDCLGSIDATEQQEIVEKFRRSTLSSRPSNSEGVELDVSLLARFEEQNREATSRGECSSPLDELTEEEELTLANALSIEHPQTIALILSRLNPEKASKLLGKLSPNTQSDVMTRLADGGSTDEQTIQVVESQLAQWLDQQRELKKRLAAGIEHVERILESTPRHQRHVILTQLKAKNPLLAKRLTPTTDPSLIGQVHEPTRATPQHESPGQVTKQPVCKVAEESELSPLDSDLGCCVDPLRELESLDDYTLLAALSQSEPQIATLALAGANDELMERVLRGLPRRQAKKLRHQLRNVGPTRLCDMLSAQEQLLQIAKRLNSEACTQLKRSTAIPSRF